jgi:hypothetical protein
MIDCPETPEARALTPWPYQLYSLIGGPNGGPNGLYNRVIRNTAAADLDQIVLSLPCGDYVSAFALIQITLDIARRSHHVRPEIFATWLNALHNPNGTLGVERATIGIMSSAAQSIAPTKADESWANLQILGLEAIDTKDSTQTVPVISGIRYILPLPNTLVLAAARYLEQAGDLHSSWRALQAKTLLEAVSPGTSAPGSSSGPVSDESQIAAFNSWFSQNRIALEERADAERDIIASARDRLKRTSGACRP